MGKGGLTLAGPRQQVPHFVRPCENEDERVIAFFLYYIRHCIFFLYIIFVGFLSCLEFLIDWNEYMFANKPEGIRAMQNLQHAKGSDCHVRKLERN